MKKILLVVVVIVGIAATLARASLTLKAALVENPDIAVYLLLEEEGLGRTELLRGLGARYRDLELERRLFLPAAEAYCRYEAPARYDDLLTVRTWVSALGKASVSFAYEVLGEGPSGRRLAAGRTRHAVVDERWKPARLPEDLRAALDPFLGSEPER